MTKRGQERVFAHEHLQAGGCARDLIEHLVAWRAFNDDLQRYVLH